MIDAELNVLPSMADNMRVSSDGLTYLFRLREGVRWSDGEPLTADDFAFTWMRMRELETRPRSSWRTSRPRRPSTTARSRSRCASRAASSLRPRLAVGLPLAAAPLRAAREDWHRPENLVSNGPFTLAEFDDEHALLTANPH